MAFNFNAINDQLQEKANIFGGSETAQTVAGDAEAPAAPSSGSTSPSTSQASSTQASPNGASAPKGPKGTGGGAIFDPSARQAAWDSQGPSGYSQQTDKIGSNISNANDKLQAEANTYSTKAQDTAKGYKVDDETLGKAADGDEASFGTVASRISKALPDQFEAFKGLGDDQIPTSASAISKPSDFGEIYRDSAGSDYTTGQNRLNSMQLRRSGDFRNIAMQLGQQNEDLLSNNAKQQDELTASTRKSLGDTYAQETADAKSRLGAMGDSIVKTAKDQELAEEARRAGIDIKSMSAAEFEKLKPELLRSLSMAGITDADSYLNDASQYDLSDYIKRNGDVDYRSFITDPQAQKFNRIHSLMGDSSEILSPVALASEYSFDPNGAQDKIAQSVIGKSNEARRQAEIQAQAAAQAEAQRAQAAAQAEAERQAILKAQGDAAAKAKAIRDAEQAYQEKLMKQRGSARETYQNPEFRRGI